MGKLELSVKQPPPHYNRGDEERDGTLWVNGHQRIYISLSGRGEGGYLTPDQCDVVAEFLKSEAKRIRSEQENSNASM